MFKPKYSITPKLASILMQIEATRQKIALIPITATVLAGLRESSKLQPTHYSTKKILGYYEALDFINELTIKKSKITHSVIKKLHAITMDSGKKDSKAIRYRNGHEAKDVEALMGELIDWLKNSKDEGLPIPIIAAIAHYQFTAIRPYYDGTDKTARLLAALILYQNEYDLNGICYLDEHYAQKLSGYYGAILVGEDITNWIEYFCISMAESFAKVEQHVMKAQRNMQGYGLIDLSELNQLQRKVLALLEVQKKITVKDLAEFLKISPRNANTLVRKWVKEGFVEIADPSKKNRLYRLSLKQ